MTKLTWELKESQKHNNKLRLGCAKLSAALKEARYKTSNLTYRMIKRANCSATFTPPSQVDSTENKDYMSNKSETSSNSSSISHKEMRIVLD